MSETKFTPGPWRIGANKVSAEEMKEILCAAIDGSIEHGDADDALWSVFVGSEEEPLMVCYAGNGPTSAANARLIVAAPEMYEALRNIIDGIDADGKVVARDRFAARAALIRGGGGQDGKDCNLRFG